MCLRVLGHLRFLEHVEPLGPRGDDDDFGVSVGLFAAFGEDIRALKKNIGNDSDDHV